MDGKAADLELAERLAQAGLVTHLVRLDPAALPGFAFDAGLESAALAALCDNLPGQVFRLEAFSYGFEARPEEAAIVAGLAETLGMRLFGAAIPGAVAVAPVAPGAAPPALAGDGLILVGALGEGAREAAGPAAHAVLDARFAVAAAGLAAERIGAGIEAALDRLAERVRAVFPAPVAVPAELPGAPALLARLAERLEALDAPAPLTAEALAAALAPAMQAALAEATRPLAERLDAALAELARLAERPAPPVPAAPPAPFRGEAEALARLAERLPALTRRMDLHAEGLEELVGRLQARLAEPETALIGLDERLGGIEAALLRLGEQRRGEAGAERAAHQLIAPLAAEIAAIGPRLGTLAGLIEGLAARPVPTNAPLEAALERGLAAQGEAIAALAGRLPAADRAPLALRLEGEIAGLEERLGRRGDALAAGLAALAARPLAEAPALAALAGLVEGLAARPLAEAADLEPLALRLEALAEAEPQAALAARIDQLGARLGAQFERLAPDLAPLGRRLDRMAESLQSLATRAAVSAQAIGPERGRLQQAVLALQGAVADLGAAGRGGGEGTALETRLGALEARLAAMAESLGRLADPAAGARLAERLAAALPEAVGPRLARLEAVFETFQARPGPAGAAEGFEARLFAEIGNLRLMLGGLRSSLREIDRSLAIQGEGGSALAARLDQMAALLARLGEQAPALPGPEGPAMPASRAAP